MEPETGQAERSDDAICVIGDGGGAHVRSRVGALAKISGPVHLVTPRPSDLDNITETVVATSAQPTLAAFAAWRDAVSAVTAGVLSIHYASSWGAWVFALMNDRRPMVLTVMGGDVLFDEQSNPHPLARWLTRCVYRRADIITAKTDHLASALVSEGVDPDRIKPLVWGIDTTVFSPGDRSAARQTLDIDPDALVVFSPRMLSPLYNIDVMIRAVAELRKTFPAAQLFISEYEADVGYRDQLKSLVVELGLGDAVKFVGKLSPRDMAVHYRACDVAVGLPRSDGFPQTVFEAMACGTANVVPPLDRYREFVADGETVIFADPNPDGLAAALSTLFSDKSLRAQLIENGFQKIATVPTIDDSARALFGHLQELHQRKPDRRLGMLRRWAGRAILVGLALRSMMRPSDGSGA